MRCFFVWYSSHPIGYRLYDHVDKVIIGSIYVEFLKDHFDCEDYLGEKEKRLRKEDDSIVGTKLLKKESNSMVGASFKKRKIFLNVEPIR